MENMRIVSKFISCIFLTSLMVAGCSSETIPEPISATTSQTNGDAWLADYDLAGLDARQIIDKLDATSLANREQGLRASIEPENLILSDTAGNELSLPMPAQEFYVSVAPYVDATHECFYHSLTTCIGELKEQPITVTITNTDTKEVLVKEDTTTFNNGFVGYWLPRNIKATMTIDYDGKTAEVPVNTGEKDPTCVTTAKLT